jgi:phosphate-selective porin OprO/OprP
VKQSPALVAAAALAGLLTLTLPIQADDPETELARLKARLERLEKMGERQDSSAVVPSKGTEQPGGPIDIHPLARSSPNEQELKKKETEEAQKKKEAEEGTVVGDLTKFDGGSWRHTLLLESADKAFRLHLGGRMHVDGAGWAAPANITQPTSVGGVGPLEDGVAFRRARLRAVGTIYETLTFFTEYGFETGAPQFFDVFMEINRLPYLGTVRVGHFREPFSMDALTSGNFLTFLERSLIQDAFVPFRNTGIMVYNTALDEHATWAVGLFRTNSNAVGQDGGDGDYSLTGRATLNPWYTDPGAGALHLGVAGSFRDLTALNNPRGVESARFATRPEIRPNAPNFADTGLINADSEKLAGVEFGLGLGPLLVQGEYVAAVLDNAVFRVPAGSPPRIGSMTFHGGYLQASYFLTGEFRPYLRNQGVFGHAVPHENFFCVEGEREVLAGHGAWEIGVRYSHIDLNDDGVVGGRLNDVTFGLNWYLNPNARVMWNYILAWRDAAGAAHDGLTQIFATRFQVDF